MYIMYIAYDTTMADEIPVTEARAQFSELVNRVGYGKERIVLTRHGKPLVALVPAETLSDVEAETDRYLDVASQPTSYRSSAVLAAQDTTQPRA